MHFNININQKAIMEIAKKTGVKLNLKHASLISSYRNFALSSKTKKQIINNKVFVWMSYSEVLEQNPLLGLEITSKEVLARYFTDLIKAEIIERYLDKKEGNRTYFGAGKYFDNIYSDNGTLPTLQSIPSDSTVDTLPTLQSDNNIYNNNYINKKEKSNKKESEISQIKTNNLHLIRKLLTDTDTARGVVQNTLMPYPNQVWWEEQASVTLSIIQKEMERYYTDISSKNKNKRTIKNIKSRFVKWLKSYKRSDFYKYQDKNINQPNSTNKVKIEIIKRSDFETQEDFENQIAIYKDIQIPFEIQYD